MMKFIILFMKILSDIHLKLCEEELFSVYSDNGSSRLHSEFLLEKSTFLSLKWF